MPNQWLLAAVSTASVAPAITNRHGFSGVGSNAQGEVARETRFSGNYTVRNLLVRISASTISAGAGTVRTRKNIANGAQSVSVTGTGLLEDTTNSDSYANGDTGCIQFEPATTGAYSPSIVSVILESTANAPVLMQVTTGQAVTLNATHYPQIMGGLGKAVTEADAQYIARMDGTLSKLRAYNGTALDATLTIKVRKNGADGNQAVSWSASTTGAATDSSNTDSFVIGDLLNYQWTNASLGTNGNVNEIQTDLNTSSTWLGIVANTLPTQAEPLTRYYAWNGFLVATATEADVQLKVRSRPIARNLFVRIPTNGITAATTFTLRKNTADTALTVSVGSSATGTFEDTTDTVPLVETDVINMAVVTPSVSGTPTIAIAMIMMQLDQQDMPELRGRPFGQHGAVQMQQLLSQ